MGWYKRLKSKIPWWFRLNWRNTRVMPILFVIELPPTIAALALSGIADPDTYRTLLWQEGSDQGWNSDPSELLYAAANYKPMQAPTPWNSFITQWNVVIAVLCLFIYLVKIVMYITKSFPPLLSSVVHSGILAVWLVSISQQAGSDYSDPDHPSKFPWYLQRGCGAPVSAAAQGGCKMAIGAFVVTVLMSSIFLTYLIVSIIFSIPNSHQKTEARIADEEDDEEEFNPVAYYDDKHAEYEMDSYNSNQAGKSAAFSHVPATPRTQAFNALEGRRVGQPARVNIASPKSPPLPSNKDLPLRHHISMGEETYGNTRFA